MPPHLRRRSSAEIGCGPNPGWPRVRPRLQDPQEREESWKVSRKVDSGQLRWKRYFEAYKNVLVGSMVASRGTGVPRKASSLPGQAARDSSPLAELYVRYWPAAVKLGYLLTGDKDMAEDLAQEAFIRVAGRFGHLRHVGAFDAYLRRTLVNLHVSGIRRLRLERAYMAKERAGLRAGPPNEPDVPEELWRALQELPRRQRTAIVLRYYEDLSEQAAADELRCSVAAVKSLVARGMATLRLSMGELQ